MTLAPDTTRFKAHWLRHPFQRLFSTRVLDVSPTRITYITGALDRDERTMMLSKITDVTVDQSFWGNIFGVRTLTIQTSGADDTEVIFNGMSGARQARDLILKYIDASKKVS